jgi:hypothetical protein
MRAWLSILMLIALTACGAGQEKSSEFIPDIPVECTAAQAADCSGTGYTVYVGLTNSLGADCDDYLSGQNATQRRQSFDVTGSASASRNGIYLIATIDSWINSSGGTADVLLAGDYEVCAFIDTNGNGVIDTNEPTGTGTVTAGQTGFILNTWAPAFN